VRGDLILVDEPEHGQRLGLEQEHPAEPHRRLDTILRSVVDRDRLIPRVVRGQGQVAEIQDLLGLEARELLLHLGDQRDDPRLSLQHEPDGLRHAELRDLGHLEALEPRCHPLECLLGLLPEAPIRCVVVLLPSLAHGVLLAERVGVIHRRASRATVTKAGIRYRHETSTDFRLITAKRVREARRSSGRWFDARGNARGSSGR
jgi:hypothetical protein